MNTKVRGADAGPRAHALRRWLATTAALTALCGNAPAAPAAPAHEHGAVKLDIAIEAGKVTLGMESPLDSLIGFERAPRTDAERQRVAAMVARLRAADTLFTFDAAAGCTLAGVELVSAPLKLGKAEPQAAGDEHADLDGDFAFDCKDTGKLGFIDVGLFKAFAGMQRIDVQVATPKGQLKRTLTRPASRISLVR
jgi:Protein of unknown function (DUF2796)